MAELAARNKRKEAEHRLRLSMKTLATLLLGADERRPTEQKLSWQLAASKGDWESYDKAHFAHLAMLEADQEAIQQEEYDVQYEMVHQLMEETEDLLEARRGALAAALQPPTPEQEEEVELIDEKADEVRAAKEESLRVLLKNTALKIDDVLEDFTGLEEMEKSRVLFWSELSRLDMAEDEERSSGKKEEDLGTLSVRRFKRTAMTRFANCVGLLNQAKLLSSRERPAVLRADSKVGKVSSKSEEKLVAIDPVTQEKELKTEAEAVENVKILRMSEGESSSEIEFGESGPVKEEHEVRDAMVDKQVGSGGAEAQAAWQDADCDEGVRDFLKTLQ